VAGAGSRAAVLLADDAVRREGALDARPEQLLGLPVGHGHGGGVVLELDVEFAAEVRQGEAPGGERRVQRDVEEACPIAHRAQPTNRRW
jgi:hypothetical protein